MIKLKYLKLALVVVIGLVLGMVIHGVVEILTIWVLTNWLNDFFLGTSWNSWLLIHLIFTIVVGILGIILALQIFKKYWK